MESRRNDQAARLPSFTDFVPQLTDQLQQAADTYLDEFDEHRAFVYLVAELFETTDEQRFTFTDGPKDGGVDFFIRDDQSYTIYQCKCPAIETLESLDSAYVFDDTGLQELLAAIDLLRDPKGSYDVKQEIKRLRSDYHRDLGDDPQGTALNANLAILGELSPQASQAFASQRQRLLGEGITVSLVTWADIYRRLHEPESLAEVPFGIDLHFDDPDKDLLRHRDYCYLLAYGIDFYKAFREHGWRLFDWNVRLQIPKSAVNKRIVASLKQAKTRKQFHHLNNGILLTCRTYSINEREKRVRLEGPQVVNGCQTVSAMRDAFEALEPYQQREFQEQVRVQVKVIQSVDPDLVNQLVITTNDQNPMNPRNLKSNTGEQKDIQIAFRRLPDKWFYQRKDGEWSSLTAAGRRVRWFRQSDYVVRGRPGRKRFRVVDNEELAKNWYAFVGHSQRAVRGGVRYFQEDPIYARIFRRTPNDTFWEEFSANPYFHRSDDHFGSGTPGAYQYLLANAVTAYIKAQSLTSYKAKQAAIRRGIEQGKLREDPATGDVLSLRSEIDEFLAKDSEYRLDIMIRNMQEVLAELFSFILCRRYGPLQPATCQKLLGMPAESAFCACFFDPNLAPDQRQDGQSVFGPLYAFLRYCMKQYYFENKAEIQAAPRIKAYFFSRENVNRIRNQVLRRDSEIVEWDSPWKPGGKTYVDTLPGLT